MEEAFPPWGIPIAIGRERGLLNAGSYRDGTGRERKGVSDCWGKRERGYVNAGESGGEGREKGANESK